MQERTMELLNVGTVSIEELSLVLRDTSKEILILDGRPFLSYNECHIRSASNVHCPRILKRRSGGFISLENIVQCEHKRQLLISKTYYSAIVVYDEDTIELSSAAKDSNLYSVLKSLKSQLPEHEVCFLEGGFDAFRQKYQHLCVGLPDDLPGCTDATSTATTTCHPDKTFPVEVTQHVYIGDSNHASQLQVLRDIGITAVLNVSTTCPNNFTNEFLYMSIPVQDSQSADLRSWFQRAINFIDSVCSKNGKVLVHCHAGISRSATICLAYLMNKKKLSLDQAFEFLLSRRNVISPNLNFMRQLKDYEDELADAHGRLSGKPNNEVRPNELSSGAMFSFDFFDNENANPKPPSSANKAFSFDFADSGLSSTHSPLDLPPYTAIPLQPLTWKCNGRTPTFDFPSPLVGFTPLSNPGTPLLSPS